MGIKSKVYGGLKDMTLSLLKDQEIFLLLLTLAARRLACVQTLQSIDC